MVFLTVFKETLPCCTSSTGILIRSFFDSGFLSVFRAALLYGSFSTNFVGDNEQNTAKLTEKTSKSPEKKQSQSLDVRTLPLRLFKSSNREGQQGASSPEP